MAPASDVVAERRDTRGCARLGRAPNESKLCVPADHPVDKADGCRVDGDTRRVHARAWEGWGVARGAGETKARRGTRTPDRKSDLDAAPFGLSPSIA